VAKAELKAAQDAYDQLLQRAQRDESLGRYATAVTHAVEAWEYVDGMMKYERRFEDAEFKSLPCIDLVLRYAPLLFDVSSLDRLGELLKKHRSVEKHTTDDLEARLTKAREFLCRAHRLWSLIEQNPGITLDEVTARLGDKLRESPAMVARWEEMGLITRSQSRTGVSLRLTTRLESDALARCPSCGAKVQARKLSLWKEQRCPKCGQTVDLVIFAEVDEVNGVQK
jgi:predicted Zn-ribbon and HTH transcriptional regulator